jgi:HSP20 family molecular chaperone IbpA
MTLEDFQTRFFYTWPFSEPKPPSSAHGVLSEDEKRYTGVEIQFALAGFKEEDLKVWTAGRNIYVEGDNTARSSINPKFQCRFSRKIPVQESLDLDSVEVKLLDGILSIKLSTRAQYEDKKLLFGHQPEPAPSSQEVE